MFPIGRETDIVPIGSAPVRYTSIQTTIQTRTYHRIPLTCAGFLCVVGSRNVTRQSKTFQSEARTNVTGPSAVTQLTLLLLPNSPKHPAAQDLVFGTHLNRQHQSDNFSSLLSISLVSLAAFVWSSVSSNRKNAFSFS